MALTFVRAQGSDFDTGTYLFFMTDGATEIRCGVSETAMDDAEHARNVRAHQRDAQFERLKDRITQCAADKYLAGNLEAGPSRIVIRSIDLTPRH
jgi:hypothetical protein